MFRHPTGFEVEARAPAMAAAFEQLEPLWPRGLPVTSLLPGATNLYDDLRLLHRHGMVELRLVEPHEPAVSPERLHQAELGWGGYRTTPFHATETSPSLKPVSKLAARDADGDALHLATLERSHE